MEDKNGKAIKKTILHGTRVTFYFHRSASPTQPRSAWHTKDWEESSLYILYSGPHVRGITTEMVLLEGDLPFEIREVNMLENEHRTDEFLALNPAGKLPILITPDGSILTETPAINLYLAERHDLRHIAPGIDENDRGSSLSGVFMIVNEIEPMMKVHYYPHRYSPRRNDDQATAGIALERVLDALQIIEDRLNENGPFHLGERFSLVDLLLAYWLRGIEPELGKWGLPAIEHCRKLVMNREKLRPLFERLKKQQDDYAKLMADGAGVV